jgi:hypothetical protein
MGDHSEAVPVPLANGETGVILLARTSLHSTMYTLAVRALWDCRKWLVLACGGGLQGGPKAC